MNFLYVSIKDGIAEARLKRGKVNAINGATVEEIVGCFQNLAASPEVRAVILTGDGSFFSFGFDTPELLSYSREAFTSFVTRFTDLYRYLFTLVAALNRSMIESMERLERKSNYCTREDI